MLSALDATAPHLGLLQHGMCPMSIEGLLPMFQVRRGAGAFAARSGSGDDCAVDWPARRPACRRSKSRVPKRLRQPHLCSFSSPCSQTACSRL